jgi:hypothetical protein
MKIIGRTLCGLALLLFAIGAILGFVPTRAVSVEYTNPNREVNCGSFWIGNEYSSDAGCDDALLSRFGWVWGLALGAIPIGIVGAAILLRERRHGRTPMRA